MTGRSPITALGVLAAGPLAIVLATYLFFAGHNGPGGGFAAGLVLAAVVTLRRLAGLPTPSSAIELVAAGMLVTTAVAASPLLAGEVLLDQLVGSIEVPVLGTVKSGTALLFDLGVSAIVVGLVIALLDGLTPTAPHDTDDEPDPNPNRETTS